MSKALLAVDPGSRGCGCAIFEIPPISERRDWAQLRAAAYVKNPAKTGAGPREVAQMARAIDEWVFSLGAREVDPLILTVEQLALEMPQTYGGRASKGDANDLLPLAGVICALAALYPNTEVFSYHPREWKSNIDADVMIERIKARLTPAETARVSLPTAKGLAHNVWDGVGIGLHAIGRLKPRKVYATE